MKRTYRCVTIACILCTVLITAVVSCSQSDVQKASGVTDISTAKDSVSETVDEYADSLPENLDFNGVTVRVISREGGPGETWYQEMYIEDLNGDVVNDAVYNRNRYVEERLNLQTDYIVLGGSWSGKDNFLNTVTDTILAGDDTYDLIFGYQYYTPSLVSSGCVRDLSDIPYLDFKEPWWPEDIMSELKIGGKLYLITGDIALSMTKSMFVTYYNKMLADAYALDMNTLVKDGAWTLDKCIEISRTVTKDLDGDGALNENTDQMGYVSQTVTLFFSQFNVRLTEINNKGLPEYTLNDSKIADIVEKMYAFNYDTKGVVSHDTRNLYTPDELTAMFESGRFMFYVQTVGMSEQLRNMKDDFGIIPLFKWDENQENYCTKLRDDFSLICVPVTCTRTEAVGAFTEAMASESYKSVIPAYYITTLGNKVTRDSESYQMLEMIHDNIIFSFEMIYSTMLSDVGNILNTLMTKSSSGWASYYASNSEMWQSSLNNVIESIAGLKS